MSLDRGKLLNEHASLGMAIVTLREKIPTLEKVARKTPPKHMKVERAKVQEAKDKLPVMKELLAASIAEHRVLTLTLENMGAWGEWRKQNPGQT